MIKIKSFIVNYIEEIFLFAGIFFIILSSYIVDRILGLFVTGVACIVICNLIIKAKKILANKRRR